MKSIIRAIKTEMIKIFPAVAFFLIAFNLIVLTDMLTMKEFGIHVFSFIGATLAAVLVAKVVFLTNALPIMNIFSGKPLIYNTLWKTFVYFTATLVIRYSEHIIRLSITYKSISLANHRLFDNINWPRFYAIEIWFIVLFFIFSAFQEIVIYFGKSKIRKIFLG